MSCWLQHLYSKYQDAHIIWHSQQPSHRRWNWGTWGCFFKAHLASRFLFNFIRNWRLFKMLLPTDKNPFHKADPFFSILNTRSVDLIYIKPSVFTQYYYLYMCESVLKPYFVNYLKRKRCDVWNILNIIPLVLLQMAVVCIPTGTQ